MRIDWLASGFTLVGSFVLVKYKAWWIFLVYLSGNVLWAIHWLGRKEWAAFLLVLIFCGMNIWGLIKWRRET